MEDSVEIVNTGTDKFPFFSIMLNGEEFCSTHDIQYAERIKRMLLSDKQYSEKDMDNAYDKGVKDNTHCSCTPDETTGTTAVQCCNICGKPAEDFWKIWRDKKMVLKVERESVYKKAKVTEPDGTVRIIPPLYFGQMIWKGRDGRYRYDNKVPENYWEKRSFLIDKGWEHHYHFDIDWQKGDYDDKKGTTTENALKIEGYYENNNKQPNNGN